MVTSVAPDLAIQARYSCQLPGVETGTTVLDTSVELRKVLNQLRASPLNSRMSMRGDVPAVLQDAETE